LALPSGDGPEAIVVIHEQHPRVRKEKLVEAVDRHSFPFNLLTALLDDGEDIVVIVGKDVDTVPVKGGWMSK